MTVYYECDYNKLPFNEVVKTVFGKAFPHSFFAKECYRKHGYIYQSSCGAIYGAETFLYKNTIKLSSVLKNVELGRL